MPGGPLQKGEVAVEESDLYFQAIPRVLGRAPFPPSIGTDWRGAAPGKLVIHIPRGDLLFGSPDPPPENFPPTVPIDLYHVHNSVRVFLADEDVKPRVRPGIPLCYY